MDVGQNRKHSLTLPFFSKGAKSNGDGVLGEKTNAVRRIRSILKPNCVIANKSA
jgi:hypothetical protein